MVRRAAGRRPDSDRAARPRSLRAGRRAAPDLPPLSRAEISAIERDADDEMFGEDADYLRHAGLNDKIGNK